ncbi:MAG TPA: SDR family NAD(P)-dependent oxidoreductase [Longimicrobiaceae bacterium]|nr:SDR family NAD(P)-dependent oxidoreductase [Longimicrobiaceae bacterium]
MPRAAWVYRDRWALVTGASAGLGEEFARQLAARGVHLVLTARREERLRRLAEELAGRHSVSTLPLPIDLSRPGAAAELWERASRAGPIHLLVNNAGFGTQGRFDKIALERQVEMVRLDCTALLELTHHALRDMRPRGEGGIVNVASIAAYQPVPLLATYAASKAFVLSLSEALHAENEDAGVRVLALSPGRTPTEFQEVAGTGSTEGAFGVRSPEQVVAAALAALEHGRSSVVPGWENAMASRLVRVLPRSALTLALKRLVRARAPRKGGTSPPDAV